VLGKPVEELSRIMEVVRCEISRGWSVVASSDSPVSTELPFLKQAVRMLSVSNVWSLEFSSVVKFPRCSPRAAEQGLGVIAEIVPLLNQIR
jgi:hypothetical protein